MKMRYLAGVLCVAAAAVYAHAQDAGVLKLPQDIEFRGAALRSTADCCSLWRPH